MKLSKCFTLTLAAIAATLTLSPAAHAANSEISTETVARRYTMGVLSDVARDVLTAQFDENDNRSLNEVAKDAFKNSVTSSNTATFGSEESIVVEIPTESVEVEITETPETVNSETATDDGEATGETGETETPEVSNPEAPESVDDTTPIDGEAAEDSDNTDSAEDTIAENNDDTVAESDSDTPEGEENQPETKWYHSLPDTALAVPDMLTDMMGENTDRLTAYERSYLEGACGVPRMIAMRHLLAKAGLFNEEALYGAETTNERVYRDVQLLADYYGLNNSERSWESLMSMGEMKELEKALTERDFSELRPETLDTAFLEDLRQPIESTDNESDDNDNDNDAEDTSNTDNITDQLGGEDQQQDSQDSDEEGFDSKWYGTLPKTALAPAEMLLDELTSENTTSEPETNPTDIITAMTAEFGEYESSYIEGAGGVPLKFALRHLLGKAGLFDEQELYADLNTDEIHDRIYEDIKVISEYYGLVEERSDWKFRDGGPGCAIMEQVTYTTDDQLDALVNIGDLQNLIDTLNEKDFTHLRPKNMDITFLDDQVQLEYDAQLEKNTNIGKSKIPNSWLDHFEEHGWTEKAIWREGEDTYQRELEELGDDVVGLTSYRRKHIVLGESGGPSGIQMTAVHEYVHYIADAISTANPNNKAKLNNLYHSEAKAAEPYLRAYATTNSSEYIADFVAYWLICTDRQDSLRQVAPQTVEYVETLLHDFNDLCKR